MKALVTTVVLFLVAACASLPPTRSPADREDFPAAVSSPPSGVHRGQEAADQLRGWYENVVSDCGHPGLAAPLCSGVMLRATENNPAFLPWDPSPGSITSGGVSFSWLRRDNNFASLVFHYRNGFIFYPVFDTPPGKNSDIGVLCVFPMDANTVARPTLQGCGPSPKYPAETVPCTDQGIVTAAQWLGRFNTGNDRYDYQCGWTVREGDRDQAANFMAAIGARNGMDETYWRVQNELRLATWATGSGAQLPIQSFFYLAGDADARAKAQDDRFRYFQHYGQEVPVIQLTLPATKGGTAVFAFLPEDQNDLTPTDLVFDTTPVTLGGKAYIITARQDILPPFDASNSITRTASGGRPPYIYRSTNPGVAAVSPAGEVTPRANGTASISVTDAAGASRAFGVTFQNIVQVRFLGVLSHAQAVSAAGAAGERLPSDNELVDLQRSFAGRWPYNADYYWSSQGCITGYKAFLIHAFSDLGFCYPFIYAKPAVGLK